MTYRGPDPWEPCGTVRTDPTLSGAQDEEGSGDEGRPGRRGRGRGTGRDRGSERRQVVTPGTSPETRDERGLTVGVCRGSLREPGGCGPREGGQDTKEEGSQVGDVSRRRRQTVRRVLVPLGRMREEWINVDRPSDDSEEGEEVLVLRGRRGRGWTNSRSGNWNQRRSGQPEKWVGT